MILMMWVYIVRFIIDTSNLCFSILLDVSTANLLLPKRIGKIWIDCSLILGGD